MRLLWDGSNIKCDAFEGTLEAPDVIIIHRLDHPRSLELVKWILYKIDYSEIHGPCERWSDIHLHRFLCNETPLSELSRLGAKIPTENPFISTIEELRKHVLEKRGAPNWMWSLLHTRGIYAEFAGEHLHASQPILTRIQNILTTVDKHVLTIDGTYDQVYNSLSVNEQQLLTSALQTLASTTVSQKDDFWFDINGEKRHVGEWTRAAYAIHYISEGTKFRYYASDKDRHTYLEAKNPFDEIVVKNVDHGPIQYAARRFQNPALRPLLGFGLINNSILFSTYMRINVDEDDRVLRDGFVKSPRPIGLTLGDLFDIRKQWMYVMGFKAIHGTDVAEKDNWDLMNFRFFMGNPNISIYDKYGMRQPLQMVNANKRNFLSPVLHEHLQKELQQLQTTADVVPFARTHVRNFFWHLSSADAICHIDGRNVFSLSEIQDALGECKENISDAGVFDVFAQLEDTRRRTVVREMNAIFFKIRRYGADNLRYRFGEERLNIFDLALFCFLWQCLKDSIHFEYTANETDREHYMNTFTLPYYFIEPNEDAEIYSGSDNVRRLVRWWKRHYV